MDNKLKDLFKSDIIKAVISAGVLGVCNSVGMIMAVNNYDLKLVTAISTVFSFALIFFLLRAIKAGEFRK